MPLLAVEAAQPRNPSRNTMFAAIDSLIPLLIFIVIGIISAIMKKKTPDEDAPPAPPRRRESEGGGKSWEEQLRELLKGQLPQEEPAPPPLPRSQVPPPVVLMPPRHPRTPEPQPARRPVEIQRPDLSPARTEARHGFAESDLRYAHAESMGQRMTQHMEDLRRHPVELTSASRHDFQSKHLAIALVRDPKNIRAAILAQVILGQPKAMD